MKLKRIFTRATALVLTLSMLCGVLPAAAFAAEPEQDVYTLNNGFIKVDVSGKNGGFHIDTVKGNKLSKDDDNKMLLHNSGDYDTSFTSVRITRGGETKDYIFGRGYGFLGLSGTEVETAQASDRIVSTWTVEDIRITQMIVLNNASSAEHGMVSVNYTAENTGEAPVDSIQLRILLDTALGYQDYAYYTVDGEMVENERIFTGAQAGSMLFGYDNKETPKIVAYSVNGTSEDQECVPEKIAFGHWNNMASTVFDFEPNPDMTFTNAYNVQYQTADSAYALYYNLGGVDAQERKSVGTNYGVYANADVQQTARVSMNVTGASPMRLNADKSAYLSSNPNDAPGELSLGVSVQNFASDDAQTLNDISVVVYPDAGMNPLDDEGNPISGTENLRNITIRELPVGSTQNLEFRFRPQVNSKAEYRKVRFAAYLPSESGQYLQENLIGEQEVYILCPGSDNGIPEVALTGCTEYLYYTGANRILQLTCKGIDMLTDKSEYNFKLLQVTEEGTEPQSYSFDSENSTIDEVKGTAIVSVPSDMIMALGTYYVVIDYVDDAKTDVVSEAAKVVITDNEKYRPSSRTVLAVVQPDPAKPNYEVKQFPTEDKFEEYRKETTEEILLNIRGGFPYGRPNQVDAEGKYWRDYVVSFNSTPVTINDTLELRNGSIDIGLLHEGTDQQSITVDIDGSVFMAGISTFVSAGIAALTEIKNGTDYDLIQYTQDGIRCDTLEEDDKRYHSMRGKEPITYVFSEVFERFVSLANIVNADFTYLQMGKMVDNEGKDMINVASVSAKLDMGLLIPKGNKEFKAEFDSAWKEFRHGVEYASAKTLRQSWNDFSKSEVAKNYAARKTGGQIAAFVEVDDILFGDGNFIGLNFSVDIGLPPMTTSMPGISGTLSVNTINNWRFGVEGECDFHQLLLEAKLEIIYNTEKNVPVPNTVYFYLEGPPPGINIDSFGVIWIVGGGGGIKNLYEAIYCPPALPSTSLLVSVGASVMQIITLKITAELGLHGVSLVAERGTLLATDLTVLRNSGVRFQWYPNFEFSANVNVDFLGVLNGSGYIVIDPADKSYEFYAMVRLMIPQPIPLIGGMAVSSVGVGINEEKIWGKTEIIGLQFGILYYWGGDFSFISGDNDALQPSYPELLSVNDVAVAYDEESGRTLYAHVMQSYGLQQRAMVSSDLTAGGDAAGEVVLLSNADRTKHKLNLGAYETGKNGALNISFTAESEEEAKNLAGQILIENYTVEVLKDDESNAQTANAFVTYDAESKTARVVVSFTSQDDYAKDWNITTPTASFLEIYGVSTLPSFRMTEGRIENGSVAIGWTVENGTPDNLDKVSVYLSKTNDPADMDLIPVGTVSDEAAFTSGKASLPIPADTPSGRYYVKTIATMDDSLMDTQYSETSYEFVNPDQPSKPETVQAVNAGDYRLRVTETGGDDHFDAYNVNIYEVTQENGQTVYKQADGVSASIEKGREIVVGGRYEAIPDQSEAAQTADAPQEPQYAGLEAGKTYAVGLSRVKYIKDGQGEPTASVLSEETFSAPVTLAAPNPPTVSVAIQGADGSKPVERTKSLGNDDAGNAVEAVTPTLTVQDVTVTLTADQPVSGSWYLNNTDAERAKENGDPCGTFENQSLVEIPLTALRSQGHTLHIEGVNAQGDGFSTEFVFGIDDVAPVLAVNSPVNGAVAEGDVIHVEGMTDAAAVLTVSLNGAAVSVPTPTAADGSFVFDIPLTDAAKGQFKNKLTLTASDDLGNAITRTFTITNERITKLKEVAVWVGGTNVTNTTVDSAQDILSELSLMGTTETGETFTINNDDAVMWTVTPVEGSAQVYEAGETTVDGKPNTGRMLSVGKGAKGCIIGEFRLTKDAGMTAAADFGIAGAHTITYVSQKGVSVSGVTQAKAGDRVEISAVAAEGYQFKGWTSTSENVTFEDASSMETVFTMPDHDVVIQAQAEVISIDRTTLEQAIAEAKSTLDDVEISTDGKDVSASKLWTTQEQADTLQKAIDAANEVLLSESLTQDQLTEAVSAIKAAQKAFLDSCQPGKRTGGGGSARRYTVTFETNGGSSIASKTVYSNTTVSKPTEPTREGYKFEGWFTDKDCTEEYDFNTRVTKNITLYAKWTEKETPVDPDQWENPFTDVAENDWFYEDVKYAAKNGLFSGTTETTFSPNDVITRGMLVTVLWRNEKQPVVDYLMTFDDVDANAYYAEAVRWAASVGIVMGHDENIFAPDDAITREQIAAIMHRYAEHKGYDVSAGENTNILSYADYDSISEYAVDAMQYAVGSGLLKGKTDATLNPQDNATRAEIAAILHRFIEANK